MSLGASWIRGHQSRHCLTRADKPHPDDCSRLAIWPCQDSPNRELLAASDAGCRLGRLCQVLRPQGRLQFLPSVRREAESGKEARLEASQRMLNREQVISQLRRIDYSFIGVRQEHEAV